LVHTDVTPAFHRTIGFGPDMWPRLQLSYEEVVRPTHPSTDFGPPAGLALHLTEARSKKPQRTHWTEDLVEMFLHGSLTNTTKCI
jgi:hypothetical protein